MNDQSTMMREGGNVSNWVAPDLDEAKSIRLAELIRELEDIFSKPVQLSVEEVQNLTDENAELVMIAARRMLVFHLLHQELHQHMGDDCGDYLSAATDGWDAVFTQAYLNDFQGYSDHIKNYLTNHDQFPEGACDGEIRYEILDVQEDENVEEAMGRYAR